MKLCMRIFSFLYRDFLKVISGYSQAGLTYVLLWPCKLMPCFGITGMLQWMKKRCTQMCSFIIAQLESAEWHSEKLVHSIKHSMRSGLTERDNCKMFELQQVIHVIDKVVVYSKSKSIWTVCVWSVYTTIIISWIKVENIQFCQQCCTM